jgi:hypothetical protein
VRVYFDHMLVTHLADHERVRPIREDLVRTVDALVTIEPPQWIASTMREPPNLQPHNADGRVTIFDTGLSVLHQCADGE